MAVTPVALDDALPLLEADGVTGRNNATDFRQGLLNSLFSPANFDFGTRDGVLPRWWTAADGWTSMKVVNQLTASRVVTVVGGACVIRRSGQGPYVCWTVGGVDITADPADTVNPRTDIVIVRLLDKGIGDPGGGLHGAYIDIINGTPSDTPTAPATPAGAIKLAELYRPTASSGGDQIDAAKITDKRRSTSLYGGARWLMGGDLATDPGFVPGEKRIRIVNGVVLPEEYWGTDNQWHGTTPIAHTPVRGATATGGTHTGSPTAITFTIPDPGWPYYIKASGALTWDQGIDTVYYPEIRTSDGTVIARGQSVGVNQSQGTGNNRFMSIPVNRSPDTTTGPTTVSLVMQRDDGASTNPDSGVVLDDTPQYNYLAIEIIPA